MFAPPSEGHAEPSPKQLGGQGEPSHLRLDRLLVLQCGIAVALSVLVGVVVTVQFGSGLGKFGGHEYGPRVLVLSASRVFGAAISLSAGLLALLFWTHDLQASQLRPHLLRAAPWSLGLAVFIVPVGTTLAVTSGFLTSHWIYTVPWELMLASVGVLSLDDVLAAGLVFFQNLILTAGFSWFALPVMCRRLWTRLQKLGATLAALATLRVASELATIASVHFL